MFIQDFPSGPFLTKAYVVACLETSDAAVIDSSPKSFQKVQSCLSLQGFKVAKILLTHSHWDHIADVKVLKEWSHALVYVHLLDLPNLRHPGADGLNSPMEIEGVEPDILLENGMQIPIGKLTLEVIHTPGHSPGSVCFYEADEHILFSGDTLFKGAIGNVSFPTSQPTQMQASLNKLALCQLKQKFIQDTEERQPLGPSLHGCLAPNNYSNFMIRRKKWEFL